MMHHVMLLHNGKATRVGFKMDGDKKFVLLRQQAKLLINSRKEVQDLSRLKEQYQNEIVDAMIKNLDIKTSWKCRNLTRL